MKRDLFFLSIGIWLTLGSEAAFGQDETPTAPQTEVDQQEQAQTEEPTAPTKNSTAAQDPQALLEQAQKQYDNLEYDLVIEPATAVINMESVPLEKKLDAYLLLGSALSIVGDPIDAEKPFRLLLRGRPDFDLPPDTPPKILAVFRKVQVEEKAIAEQLFSLRRNQLIKSLQISGENPVEGKGGYPLIFSYELQDPKNAVDTIEIKFRREGERNFSALALKRNESGAWVGAIPGDFTSNEDGFILEYTVETLDSHGPLLVLGPFPDVLKVNITPGTVERASPPPLPVWLFATSTGVSALFTSLVALSGAGTTFFYFQYVSLVDQANAGTAVNGEELLQAQTNYQNGQLSLGVTMGLAALTWIVTAVLIPFTNWSGAEDPNAIDEIISSPEAGAAANIE